VTLEDLIEEIVGEVRDEHDPREEPLVLSGPGSWRLSGLLRPDEIFEATDIQLPEDTEYETVAGLIAMRLGRVPGQGDTVRVEARGPEGEALQVGLAVIGMDGLRVDRVRMRLIEDEMETGELLLP
jgi:CBS domain containing-hemolysin-like protein